MTNALISELHDAITSREPVVMAVVVDTEQSVPRRPGSKMLVYPDGRISGSIGGGEMESRVIETSLELFSTGRPRRLSYELVDPAEGDPGVCGGVVELYLEPHLPGLTLLVIGPTEFGDALSELGAWVGFGATTSETFTTDDQVDAYTLPVVVAEDAEFLVATIPDLLASGVRRIVVAASDSIWAAAHGQLQAAGIGAQEVDRITRTTAFSGQPSELALAVVADVIAHERQS